MATADGVKKKLQYIISEINKLTGANAKTIVDAIGAIIAAMDPDPPIPLDVTENGTYDSGGAPGYSPVVVSVPDRYQEGYDTALADYPERPESDVLVSHVDNGSIAVTIPAGRYQEINTSLNFTEPLPPYWTISPGEDVKMLYFNTEWYWQAYGIKDSLDDVLRNTIYSYKELSGLPIGEYDLITGDMDYGSRIVCAFFDLTALQPGLYVIGVGDITKMTIAYSTQDFDFTDQELFICARAGWNTTEVDFPCIIQSTSDSYQVYGWGLVSKVPVRF